MFALFVIGESDADDSIINPRVLKKYVLKNMSTYISLTAQPEPSPFSLQ